MGTKNSYNEQDCQHGEVDTDEQIEEDWQDMEDFFISISLSMFELWGKSKGSRIVRSKGIAMELKNLQSEVNYERS